ncbi:hypothetical protein PRJH_0757 [Providencia rustigianii]
MPRQISGAEFNYKLRDPQNNQAHTESFIRDGVVNVDLPGYVIPKGYRLVKSLKKEQYRLLSTDGIPETVYLLELRFRPDIIFGETTCTQIKVWRTVSHLHQTNIGDLPRIFFIHLLDSHSIMVTDEEHTRDGQRFWEIMISWAFHQDYYIYASDGTIEDRPLTQIQNEAEFFSQWVNQLWGTDIDVYTHKLVVISKYPLL